MRIRRCGGGKGRIDGLLADRKVLLEASKSVDMRSGASVDRQSVFVVVCIE